MIIRPIKLSEVNAANDIYICARDFMKRNGNPWQWSDTYPTETDIRLGMKKGASYVCVDGEEVVATFYFSIENDRSYAKIYDGEWVNTQPYAVIHRIAVKHHGKGIADFIYSECFKLHPNIKIDTHKDNLPMQRSLAKAGFKYCGIIYLESGEERLAYQKTSKSVK
ncbi:MAG: GNAT family N-acetyltransferase [Clostridia bacterium]|nr:GNAT family N-acetyltransferase [Clostridia bacterium]